MLMIWQPPSHGGSPNTHPKGLESAASRNSNWHMAIARRTYFAHAQCVTAVTDLPDVETEQNKGCVTHKTHDPSPGNTPFSASQTTL